ncbi:MAG: glycosyltransferase family 2 protein [Myxococcota bacterium]
MSVDVVIPALNEEQSIGLVLEDIPLERVRRVVVADNGSTDRTAAIARDHGAIVVAAMRRGYGSACLAALDYIRDTGPPDVVVFLDGDYSDFPEEMIDLLRPVERDGFDLVIGSRIRGGAETGALLPQARFGNMLACFLIRVLYGVQFTDLGPFRAIRWSALESLHMADPDFGWTVEMQIKAAKAGLRCTEIPVRYRKRVGVSKITGTVRGTVLAGHKILWTIAKQYLVSEEEGRR